MTATHEYAYARANYVRQKTMMLWLPELGLPVVDPVQPHRDTLPAPAPARPLPHRRRA